MPMREPYTSTVAVSALCPIKIETPIRSYFESLEVTGSVREINLPISQQTSIHIIAARRIGARSNIVIGCNPPVHCHQMADGTETWSSQNSHLEIAIASPVESDNGMQEDANMAKT